MNPFGHLEQVETMQHNFKKKPLRQRNEEEHYSRISPVLGLFSLNCSHFGEESWLPSAIAVPLTVGYWITDGLRGSNNEACTERGIKCGPTMDSLFCVLQMWAVSVEEKQFIWRISQEGIIFFIPKQRPAFSFIFF